MLATCRRCPRGAIYVPEVGPMGDEHCMTVAQARATGLVWHEDADGFLCPPCAVELELS